MDRDILGLAASLGYIDQLAREGASDPSWRPLLGGNGHATSSPGVPVTVFEVPTAPTPREASVRRSRAADATWVPGATTAPPPPSVWPLVHAYRFYGHRAATLDPLGLSVPAAVAELEPAYWGFSSRDLDGEVATPGVAGLPSIKLSALVELLQQTYCGPIGLEMMHINSTAKRTWLAERMERRGVVVAPSLRRRILEQIIGAEVFERFCHVKYPGTKRFSLEGSEGLIPMLDLVLAHGCRLGAIEAVIGMAHRGRLTTLASIMKRAPRDIFAEFEDIEPEASLGGGDVKYHLGFSTDRKDEFGAMHVSLTFNPSHLEAVDPVVVGRVRAKQARHGDRGHQAVMGVLIHGDSAFAGQGLVPETLNLMALPGYRTGGTVHLIVNNQVGFTASPAEARSTPYCTDIAKMIECPIWHVNGEDLDAVARVVEMACEYRAAFASDVVIDMYCYRKYGHNEMDEPSFTQPVMYSRIQHQPSLVSAYADRLINDGVLSRADVDDVTAKRQAALEAELGAAKSAKVRPRTAALGGLWRGYKGGKAAEVPDVDTGVPRADLELFAKTMSTVPEGFTAHPKIVRLLEQRAQMGRGERPIDWGMAEMLAYGSLLAQGAQVRLSGQDCARGTFSHRHAVITDIKTGAEHLTLRSVDPHQAICGIFDSPLSEAGVLGFEFGYSLDSPDALVIWEAQFGDFANGAQVIIDQFITACEDKWHRLSGLVLFLPHGYEGQGPEHSSARLERFLESCAEDNIQVAQPTTPAQMFHLLRRQVLRPLRKPLIVMTPKSLLRLPAATSSVDELVTGTFQRLLIDGGEDPSQIRRLVFCSGKIAYELLEERQRRSDTGTAIIRIEQLYPWRDELINAALAPFSKVHDMVWAQDEPHNMGAAVFIEPRLAILASARGAARRTVSRDESASPATGSHKAHQMEQARLMARIFDGG